MTTPCAPRNSGHGYRHRRLLPSRTIWFFWMMLFPLMSGCGGGGGGSGAVGPHETAYVLAENSSGAGSVVAFAFDQTNGTFYSGTSTATTGGTPVQLLFSTGGGHLFVLNSTSSGSSTGSVASFAISSSTGAISSSPVSTLTTGTSPTSMAVDPGGNYLVIANNGSSSNAYIQVASVSGGSLSATTYSPSPCTNPYRVVFSPAATGSSSDIFYVACSTSSSPTTPPSLYSCQISQSSCTPITDGVTSTGYWTNLTLDPGKNHLVGVGTIPSTPSGFLVVCPATSPGSCNTTPTGTTVPDPSGNVAFSSSTGTEQVFIGNYLLGQTATTGYNACTVATSLSCTGSSYLTSGTPPAGPIFLLANTDQVYIAATVDTIDSSSTPSSGYLLACPVTSSGLNTCTPAQTAVDPVWITLDPSGNYLFVPTLSGELDVFGGASSGNLTFAASSSLSGLQAISVTFQP